MKVHVWIILLFFSSIAYAEEDIRWKDADEKMQEQQYEEAAKLYKELSHKSDTVYEEINSRGVKDMRKIYSIDELELANSQQQNRLLSLALIILPFFIAIAIGCVVYLRKQRRKLIQSQLKLQQAQEEVEKSTRNKSLFISNMSHEIPPTDQSAQRCSGYFLPRRKEHEVRPKGMRRYSSLRRNHSNRRRD